MRVRRVDGGTPVVTPRSDVLRAIDEFYRREKTLASVLDVPTPGRVAPAIPRKRSRAKSPGKPDAPVHGRLRVRGQSLG